MSYSLLLLAILFLLLLILRILHNPRRPLLESFANLKTDPDFQRWMEFQNNEYCSFWNEFMEIASKNDQAEIPKDQQLNLADYSKKLQDNLNKLMTIIKRPNITFVVCNTPITTDMPLSTLLTLVPEGPQNYLDSVGFMIMKMNDAIQKVNDALKNEGFTPFKREFEYVDNPDTTTTYTSTDGTNITFITPPKTPEEQKVEAEQTDIIQSRIKAILQGLDSIRAQIKKAKGQKAQLEEIKKKGEDGSLYSKDGSVPKAKSYGPPNGRLFYN